MNSAYVNDMTRIEADIFISGGGIAGLTAAIALAQSGLSVVLADPARAVSAAGPDLRTTAYLAPARDLLERVGLWDKLSPEATPLQTLRVIDLAGTPPAITADRDFQSTDLGTEAFGWNLPNWLTRKVLLDAAAAIPGLTLLLGTGFERMLTRETGALVWLDDGTRCEAKLVIGADGHRSPVREAAGIDCKTTRYGQKAIACAVSHAVPHEFVSTELYLSGGAFVLVPLPDQNGSPASAIVWMADGPEAQRLAGLDDSAFGKAASERSAGVLGDLVPLTARRVWPVITQRAHTLVAERVALMAEAAHVMPPIGAQGLNTSFHDISALLTLAEAAPGRIGHPDFLDRYAKERERAVAVRSKVIDLYNRLCKSDAPPVQSIRSAGLKLIHDIPAMRHGIMRAGMNG